MDFEALVKSRRSVRKYDQITPFDHDAVQRALTLATLSPNSSNMQLWEFHRVITPEKRATLAQHCFGQNAAATASELVVFTVTPSKWRARSQVNAQQVRQAFTTRPDGPTAKKAYAYYEKLIPFVYRNDKFGLLGRVRKLLAFFLGIKKPIVREVSKQDVRVSQHKSCALAAMTFMLAMRAEGYDTCAMEGFDSKRVKRLLNLPQDTEINMIIGCGQALPEGIYGERHRVDNEDVIVTH